jgi:hypothetical protein
MLPLDVGNLPGRVGHGLGEDELGFGGDGRSVVGRVGAAHKRGVDTKTAQGDIQLGDRTAVEVGGGDDVIAGTREGGKGDELSAQAARGGDGAEATLEARDALLECGNRRVRQARVDVAVLLQGKAGGRVGGVVENEGGRLVDRQCARSRHRVGNIARVDSAGPESVFTISHALTLPAENQSDARRRNTALPEGYLARVISIGATSSASPCTASRSGCPSTLARRRH